MAKPITTLKVGDVVVEHYGIPDEHTYMAVEDERYEWIGCGGNPDEYVMVECFDGPTRYSERHCSILGVLVLLTGKADAIDAYIAENMTDYERK